MDNSTVIYISLIVLWALVLLHTAVLLGVVRNFAELYHRLSPTHSGGREVNERLEMPVVKATDIFGNIFDTNQWHNVNSVFLFASPDCASCAAALYELEHLDRKERERVAIICRGTPEECRNFVERHNWDAVTVADPKSKLKDRFGVLTYPTVLMLESGTMTFHGNNVRVEEVRKHIERRQGMTTATVEGLSRASEG